MRPCALTEEPAGADLIFDQGDNITVYCENKYCENKRYMDAFFSSSALANLFQKIIG